MLHSAPLFRIYFGDIKDNLFEDEYMKIAHRDAPILELKPFDRLKKLMHIEKLTFLDQVHGVEGRILKSQADVDAYRSFSQEGDYLISCVPGVGIGIMTGDCLPVIFYDTVHHVIAIAHAGWRSAVGGICPKVLKLMQEHFDTKLDNIRIFFGPSAKVCCYEVKQDFLDQLKPWDCIEKVTRRQGHKVFFDNTAFNKLILERAGIKKEAFRVEYNLCTIDDETFCSYRRQKEAAGRQMTVASLR